MKCKTIWLVAWSLLWLGPVFGASGFQELADIRRAMVDYLSSKIRRQYQNFDIQVMALDSRLRLPACQSPLDIFPLRKTVKPGALSVGVRCHGEHPWTIYTKVVIKAFRPVVVLTRSLPRGAIVGVDAVALRRMDVGSLRQGFFPAPELVLGKQLKRPVPAGKVLNPALLTPAKVISKGDKVVIRANSSVLDVRMGGHALTGGAVGESIRVRNDRSNRIVEAVVQGPGLVIVPF